MLRPIRSTIAAAQSELQPDSGTLAADSAVARLRQVLETQVAQVASRFNDMEFQADVWPSGAAAMARWREQERAERRATPQEQARSDSLIVLLQAHGIWSRHSEGDTYFTRNESLLLEIMGPYLTRGMHDLLAMEAEEQRRPIAEDAALVLPLDELTRRIRWAEQHLEAYPSSMHADVVLAKYRQYLLLYLDGLDNTPAFDRQTKNLIPLRGEHMEQYVRMYGSSASGRLVSRYLELLQDSEYRRTAQSDELLAQLQRRDGAAPDEQ